MEAKRNGRLRIGLISDTHGTLPDEAVDSLKAVDVIVHAGDIGGPEVIGRLADIARVYAVRGNMDQGKWASVLPPTDMVQIGDVQLYILHDLLKLDLDPAAAGIRVVVHGHTHRASRHQKDGVLYVNPGSAGSPRYGHKATLACLEVEGTRCDVRFVDLE